MYIVLERNLGKVLGYETEAGLVNIFQGNTIRTCKFLSLKIYGIFCSNVLFDSHVGYKQKSMDGSGFGKTSFQDGDVIIFTKVIQLNHLLICPIFFELFRYHIAIF